MPLLKRSAADAERSLGADDQWTLTAVNNLANGYRLAGRYDEAIRLHRQTSPTESACSAQITPTP